MKHSKEFSKASLAVCMSVSSLTGLGKVAVGIGHEAPATAHVVSNSNKNKSRFANEYAAIGEKVLLVQNNARKIGLNYWSSFGSRVKASQVIFPEKNGFTLTISEQYGMPPSLKKITRSELPYSKDIETLGIEIIQAHGQKNVVDDNIQFSVPNPGSHSYIPSAYDYSCSVGNINSTVDKSGEFDQIVSVGTKPNDYTVVGAKTADFWFQRNVVEVDRLLSKVGNFEKQAMAEGSISKKDLISPISADTLCGTPK